jgi:hypothetical protein
MLPPRPQELSVSDFETVVGTREHDAKRDEPEQSAVPPPVPRQYAPRLPRAKLHSDLTRMAPDIETIVRDALEEIEVEPDEQSLVSLVMKRLEDAAPHRPPSPRDFPQLDATARITHASLRASAPASGHTVAIKAPVAPSTPPAMRAAPRSPLARAGRAPQPSLPFAPTLDIDAADLFSDFPRPVEPYPTSPPPPERNLHSPARRGFVRMPASFGEPFLDGLDRTPPPSRTARTPKRRSATPYVLLVVLTAIGVALYLDPEARRHVVLTAKGVEGRVHAEIGARRHRSEPSPTPTTATANATSPSAISPATSSDPKQVPAEILLAEACWQPTASNTAWRPNATTPLAPLPAASPRPGKSTHAGASPRPPKARSIPRATSTAEDDSASVDLARKASSYLDAALKP